MGELLLHTKKKKKEDFEISRNSFSPLPMPLPCLYLLEVIKIQGNNLNTFKRHFLIYCALLDTVSKLFSTTMFFSEYITLD